MKVSCASVTGLWNHAQTCTTKKSPQRDHKKRKRNVRRRRGSAVATAAQSSSILHVDCDVSSSLLAVARILFLELYHNMAWLWCSCYRDWRGTRSYIHFRLPPLVVPPWPVLAACDHDQGGGTPQQALTHSKFVHCSTSSSTVMDSHDSPRIIPHRRARLWAPRKSVNVWIPVTPIQ